MSEQKRTIVQIALQEFFASLFLFLMIFPIGSYLGNTNAGWAFNYFAMLLHGVIFGDACVNPSVAFGFWTMGKMSMIESYVRSACSMAAAGKTFF